MQIVIDIPEEEYQNYLKMRPAYPEGVFCYIKAIQNGTPLPKGHGDLIDRSKIGKAIPAEEDNCTGIGMTYDEMDAYNNGIDSMYDKVQRVEPIIEADKENTDEEN